MKITIKVPKTSKDKWIFRKGSGGNPLKRRTAAYTFLALKRFLTHNPRTNIKEDISIRVIYPDGGDNETLASKDIKYLLFATKCFLEEYL
jgi:hypothetical protein